MVGDQQPQQQALGEARVLQVVDEHVAVAPGEPRAHVRLLAQQPERAQHEVAEVERPRLGEQPVVGAEELGELALARDAARVVVAVERRPPTRRSPRSVTSSSLSRSMRPTIEPSSALGLPRRSWWRSGRSSMRSSSIASRSAGLTGSGERVDARLERLVVQQPRAEAPGTS